MKVSNIALRLLALLVGFTYASCTGTDSDKPARLADTAVVDRNQKDSMKASLVEPQQNIDENLYTLYVSVDDIKKVGNKIMLGYYINPNGQLTLQAWSLPLKTDTSKPGNSVVLNFTVGDDTGKYLEKDLHLSSLYTVHVNKILQKLKPTTQYIALVPAVINVGNTGRVLVYGVFLSDTQPLTNFTGKLDPTDIMLNPSPPYGFQ